MNPWTRVDVATQQRALVDREIAEWGASHPPPHPHFVAFIDAVRATECPGSILEFGCASGYGRELLDRAGVGYTHYVGTDISMAALEIAKERYPESGWVDELRAQFKPRGFDIVIDGCSLMHRTGEEEWQDALATMCASSRRWLILHRLPVGESTTKTETSGYGQTFRALRFGRDEIIEAVASHGFVLHREWAIHDGVSTYLFHRPRQFATYFDSAYWSRAKAMWTSLLRHSPGAVLHALCWDSEAMVLAHGAGMRACLGLHHAAEHASKLRGPERTTVERMWSMAPRWLAELMDGTGEPVSYVDADVFFHSSPEPIFAEMGGAPAAVIPHGFADASRKLPGPSIQSHHQFGIFNVGIVPIADQAVAYDWAERCEEWCYDRVETDGPIIKYGDQKYLERWVGAFGARRIEHPGACSGPWQVHTRSLDVRGGVIHFGSRPLIAFHYSGYKAAPEGNTQYTRPEYALTDRQFEILYKPWLKETGLP